MAGPVADVLTRLRLSFLQLLFKPLGVVERGSLGLDDRGTGNSQIITCAADGVLVQGVMSTRTELPR